MRVFYNLGLVAIAVGNFMLLLSQSNAEISVNRLFILFILSVIANVLYSSAYIVDVFTQNTDFVNTWKKWRWLLFAIGFLFAAILTRFISAELFSLI